MEFERIAVGEPYPIEIPHEGNFARLTPSGIEVVLAVTHPEDFVRECFKAGHPTRIGIAKYHRLGVLLMDFGRQFMIHTTLDAGVEPAENLPNYREYGDVNRATFTIIGVEFNSRQVFGLKVLKSSARVSREIAKLMREQMAVPTSLGAYTFQLREMFARYPTAKSVVPLALGFDKAS